MLLLPQTLKKPENFKKATTFGDREMFYRKNNFFILQTISILFASSPQPNRDLCGILSSQGDLVNLTFF
jgi:hypothetical protein